MNLVAGATGVLGGEICRRLVAHGAPVRAMVRSTSDGAKVAALKDLGVELVIGDLKTPSSLAEACEGVTTVISGVTAVIPQQPGDSVATVDDQGQKALVDAAREAGAERFIYVSYSSNIDTDSPLTRAKRSTEEHLKQSGLAYTILRPCFFMEVWLSPALGFDLLSRRVKIHGSGEAKVSWVATGDVAELAALCVGNAEAAGAVIELGGPEALSPLEVVRLAEEITGKAIETESVPVEALEKQRSLATNATEESFAGLMLNEARGDVIPMTATLERFPLRLTPVREHLSAVLLAPSTVNSG
ncbi:MAG: SDR family oxidoreductase [Gaiellaceae bacterium]